MEEIEHTPDFITDMINRDFDKKPMLNMELSIISDRIDFLNNTYDQLGYSDSDDEFACMIEDELEMIDVILENSIQASEKRERKEKRKHLTLVK